MLAKDIAECEDCDPAAFEGAVSTLIDILAGHEAATEQLCAAHIDQMNRETDTMERDDVASP